VHAHVLAALALCSLGNGQLPCYISMLLPSTACLIACKPACEVCFAFAQHPFAPLPLPSCSTNRSW
jgi:hypothetical protein